MGFNHAAAFLPLGIPEFTPMHAQQQAREAQFTPKTATGIVHNAKFTALLDLRANWLHKFLAHVKSLNSAIPVDVAVEWVNFHFPKSATDIVASIIAGEPEQLAFRLADAWEAK